MKKTLLTVYMIAAIVGGCSKKSQVTSPDNTPAAYATGTVLDTQGRPVSGAKINVDNTVFYNSGMSATTAADGTYKIKTRAGSWRVYAEMIVNYVGEEFKIMFHPDTFDSFSGESGAVRNFRWQLTGETPMNPGTYYGGSVNLGKDPDSDLYDVENVEFTFTPVGTLIDGSQGTVLRRRSTGPNTPTHSFITDVPIGRYNVTAAHIPTGRQLRVRDGLNPSAVYEQSAILHFRGMNSPRATNTMYVEYTDQ